MSWIERCCQAYDNNLDKVGKPAVSHSGKEAPMLLPIAHTTQKVNIEINISCDGNLLSGRVLQPDEMTTIIPCTEESSARTSGPVPHPLTDKLQYIAGDYKAYGGTKEPMWNRYIEQLKAWCESEYAVDCIRSVYEYLKKGSLIKDLVSHGILYADEDGTLLKKWTGEKENTPAIFLSGIKDQFESFVRFCVEKEAVYTNKKVWDSFTAYYKSTLQDIGICCVTGKKMPLSYLSPYKIRNSGDRAKLISSNDNTNFTYRGRFSCVEEAMSLGFDTTQKAHSALRWMIGKQGINIGEQTILAWGTDNESVPPITADTFDFVCGGLESADQSMDDISEENFSLQFEKAADEYRRILTADSKISIIILDSVTTGRMSIRYYRELYGADLIRNMIDWHTNFSWKNSRLIKSNSKKASHQIWFYGAPSLGEIAEAAYGNSISPRLKQITVERLIPCVTEGKEFPKDILNYVVRRVINRATLEPWEAVKTINIACALLRGYYHRNKKEDLGMSIDETCKERSYLFGRILACADRTEEYACYDPEDPEKHKRPTNALRYEAIFTRRPAKTTKLLRKKLIPYISKLIRSGRSLESDRIMVDLISRIPPDEFNDTPLNEFYLLGYTNQKKAFFKKSDAVDKHTDNLT